MKSGKNIPPSETGTLTDYSEDLYRFYFEFLDASGAAERVLRDFLGSKRTHLLRELKDGFELDLPIQCVPDVIKLLVQENIGVYQVVRYNKLEGS